MAANYFAIQGSLISSERDFSSAGLVDTTRRNRLSPKKFGAIEFAKAYSCQEMEDSLEKLPVAISLKRARNDSWASDCKDFSDIDFDGPPEKRQHFSV